MRMSQNARKGNDKSIQGSRKTLGPDSGAAVAIGRVVLFSVRAAKFSGVFALGCHYTKDNGLYVALIFSG